uniref:TMF_TATA_bd domain-containing protein n=1 Tax=Parastrongyloides trichosuri TaxID=131310 RepID=A0A0N5A3M5_PARTI
MNMNFGWASKMAKNALLQAQQKIDQVLEITPEEEEEKGDNDENMEREEISDCNEYVNEEKNDNSGNELLTVFAPSDSWHVCHEENKIVDAEPNPSRNDENPGACLMLDSSPSTISPNHDSASLIVENVNYIKDNSEHDAWESNISSPERKNNDNFETDTVASSDIEIIKQADEWSSVSGPVQNNNLCVVQNRIDNVLNQVANSSEQVKEMNIIIKNMSIQLGMRDSRISELTCMSKKSENEISILKQRIKIMEKELKDHNALKKTNKENEKIINELREEGMRLSEKIGQKDKEIKKLKLSNLENSNFKAECQRLTEEVSDLSKALDIKNDEMKSVVVKYEERTKNDTNEIIRLRSEVESIRQSWNSKENMYETKMCDIEDYKAQLEEERKQFKKLKERLKQCQNENERLRNDLQVKAEQAVHDNIDLTRVIADIEDKHKAAVNSYDNERQHLIDKLSNTKKLLSEKDALYKSLDKRYHEEKSKVIELELKVERTTSTLKAIPDILNDIIKPSILYKTIEKSCNHLTQLDAIISVLQKDISLLNKRYDLIKERNNAIIISEQNMGRNKSENSIANNQISIHEPTIIDSTDKSIEYYDNNGDKLSSPIRIDWYLEGSCENCDNMYRYVNDIKELADASLSNKRMIIKLEDELKVLNEKYKEVEGKEAENKVLLDEALQMLGEKIETIEELKQDFIDLEAQHKQTMFDLLQKMAVQIKRGEKEHSKKKRAGGHGKQSKEPSDGGSKSQKSPSPIGQIGKKEGKVSE